MCAPVSSTPRVASVKLRDQAYLAGSMDNISVIVVNLRLKEDEDNSPTGSWIGDDRIL